MRYTRREFAGIVAGSVVASGLRVPGGHALSLQGSRIAGVRVGTQSYSFRDRGLDEAIAAMKQIGLSYCELWSGHVERADRIPVPAGGNRREATRQWRLERAVTDAADIKKKFDAAGVTLTSYDCPFAADFTDDEITRVFEMGKVFGVEVITSSTLVSLAPRLQPFAAKAGMRVGFHNHSRISPDQIATPDDLATAMKAGPNICSTLDIGHFTAANFDALAFLDAHHDRIVSMHLKDRKRDQGTTLPFGEGDAPVAAVLTRLRDRKWDIPAHIEYEYRGKGTMDEMTDMLAFCRRTLETR
jgi:sugar phosphate isomerase/epimerase